MTRLAFGVTYSFGRELNGRRARSSPAPRREIPAGNLPAAVPTTQPSQTPTGTRIQAGAIPAGTAPAQKVSESAGWTRPTERGVGYQWSVTVRNNDLVAHTARATATLYDRDGNVVKTEQGVGDVAANASVTISGAGELQRSLAERGE